MLFNFQKKLILILVYCTCCICTEVGAQSPIRTQSFALADLLDAAALTYPSLVAARIEARAANEDLSATERIRWPTVSATVESYSGNLRSYPSRAVQVDQTLWDGGRNSARISESEVLANISLLKVYMQQQDLFLQMVAAWQSMISSRERVKVAQLTLARLEDYQKKMLRRVEAEASPRIDLELVDARLLQTQVELTASLSSLQVAVMRLEQFSGEVGLLGRISGAVYPLTLIETQSIANQLSHAALVITGSLVVMQGHMTMGALIASSILSGRILSPIMAIPGLLVQHAHAQAALEGLEKLYALKTDHEGTDRPLIPSSLQGHYALTEIKFSYGENPPALVIPKLDIHPKERIVILGPIGAGKSTLLRLLSGLYHPQEGKVLLDRLMKF